MLSDKQTKTLNLCVVISLATHVFFISVLQTHSLWFCAPIQSEIASNSWTQVLEKVSADDLLREAFSPFKADRQLPSFAPQSQVASETWIKNPVSFMEPPPFVFSFSPTFNVESNDIASFPVQVFSIPEIEPFNFFADLPKDLITPVVKKNPVTVPVTPVQELAEAELFASNDVKLPIPESSSIRFAKSVRAPVEVPIAKAVPSIPMPTLPQLPSLADLETMNLSDSFESELTFVPKSKGTGYVFALTLLPKGNLNIPKIRQNVIFLVDRSNSIQRDRLQSTKHAISRAIEELESDVKYNIIAFDSRLDKLFPSLTQQSADTLSKANKFIDKISLGSLFSVGELSKALFLTIPTAVPDDELYTAILMTDGESLSKKTTQRALFKEWTLQNKGRVSLYAVALTGDPNLASLDATCAINKGKLITSTTNRGLKRKVMRLAKNIRSPIAKGVVSRAVAVNPRSNVDVRLNASAPQLFLDEPYVILGSTDTLDDFILFIQARLKNGWMNVKKSISFIDAKKGGESLEAQWALQTAYNEYEKFVIDGNSSHLTEAGKILEPFDMQAVH